jgi:hypothetical protein
MSWGIGDRVGVAVSAGTIATFNSRRPGPVPSLVLDFAGTGTLDSRITFTRSTTGTYYNSSGVLTTAAINAPRFDYNPSTLAPLGLLIEQSSTNLATYSNDFTNAVWTKTSCTITPNAAVSPDGTTNASAFTTSGVSPTFAYMLQSTNIVSGVIDIYAKANTARYLVIVHGGYAALDYAIYDLVGGTVTQQPTFSGSTASMTLVNNGYYRCFLNSAQTTPVSGIIGFSVSGAATSLTTGTSGNLYIYGSQFENLTFATSYIPTTSAQVTRASDNASMTGTNFSSWFNATQGTLFVDVKNANSQSGVNGWSVPACIEDSNTNYANTTLIRGSQAIAVVANNVATSWTNRNLNPTYKVAISLAASNFIYAYNGTLDTLQTSPTTMPLNQIQLGIGSIKNTGNSYLNGRIAKISYYPQAITSAQLQALTT